MNSSTWRRWGSPILLLVVIGLLAYGAYWGWHALTRPVTTAGTPCVTQSVESALTSDKVTVRIYNGGSKTGLAKSISTQLSDKGFLIGYVGNSKEKVTQTTVVGAHADDPEVLLVAGFFPDAVVQGDGRVEHTVDVLVGNNFGGLNPNAPTQVDVPSGVVCLPASASPSATPAEGEAPTGEGEPATEEPATGETPA